LSSRNEIAEMLRAFYGIHPQLALELADMLLRGVVVRMTKNEVKYLLTFEGTELRIKREGK